MHFSGQPKGTETHFHQLACGCHFARESYNGNHKFDMVWYKSSCSKTDLEHEEMVNAMFPGDSPSKDVTPKQTLETKEGL